MTLFDAGSPPVYDTRPCVACGAPMVWALTAKGRRMPVDPDVVDVGNVELVDRGHGVAPLAVVHTGPVGGHMAHHATCPHGAEFRSTR